MFKRAPKPTVRKKIAVAVRGFAAAQMDRLLANWRYDGGFTPAEISAHLGVIRGRSRQMAKDSPHMRKFLELVATNVVGQGFSFKATPHDDRNGEMLLDAAAAKIIEYHWYKFCTHRDPRTTSTWFDLTGQKTAAEMDRMNAKTWARDGEYLIHIVRGAQNPYGISFRVLRPDYLDHTYNMADTGRGTLIHAGIEKDINTRRPVAYWICTVPRNAEVTYCNKPLMSIPARDIIHGYTQEDEDQPRGIPWVHASLSLLKMVDEYNIAEVTAARDEACSTRSYEAGDGANAEDIIDLTDPDNQEAAGALTMEKQPGQAEIVPRGYKLNIHTPQHPSRELTAFKNSMLRDVASGFLVEYANFSNDWANVNFSSVRAGTISERDTWKVYQDAMISQCKQVQFLAWLESFLSLAVSGSLPLMKIEKFSEHEFRGRRWMWVDPVKDMNAAKLARDNAWKTDTEIAADLGYDYDDNLEQMKREADSREAAGFPRAVEGPFAPVEAIVTTEE